MNNAQYQQAYMMQQQYKNYQLESRIASIEKTMDNVYINVVMNHREPGYNKGYVGGAPTANESRVYLTDEAPQNGEYNVTKTEPLLDRCSDYYCSVVRFNIPMENIPLMICPIVPNQTQVLGAGNEDKDLTPFIIGIEFGSGSAARFPINVEYFPQNPVFNDTLPTGFVQNRSIQIIAPYYFIYSYQQFLNMINDALSQAWIAAGLKVMFPNHMQPYFNLDPITNLISLIVPTYFVNVTAPAVVVPTIFMNAALQKYLDAFNVSVTQYNAPQGNDTYFVLLAAFTPPPETFYYPNGITPPAPTANPGPPTLPGYYKFTQEYSALQYWSSLHSVIISTNTIPIRNEFIPGVNNQASYITVNQDGVNVSYPILSDFVPQIEGSAGASRSIAYYLPTAQYRLADMISDNSLQKIDLQLYWVDKNGNLYPIQLSIGQQASIKLAFLKKSLYKEQLTK